MSVAELKYWEERDVANWFEQELRSPIYDDVIYNNRLDGRKILELHETPRKLTRLLDKLEYSKDYSRTEVEDLQCHIELLLEDYNKSRRSSSRRDRSSRRRDRSVSPNRRDRDKSPRRRRDRSETPRRRESRDRRDSYDSPRGRSRGRREGGKYRLKCLEVWEELDSRERDYITWIDFITYVIETQGKLGQTSKRIIKKQLDPDSRMKISRDNFFDVLPRNAEFREAIKNAVALKTDHTDRRTSSGRRGSRSESCPKNVKDVWDLIDQAREDRVPERRWMRFLRKYCSWVSDDDSLLIFEYIDHRNDGYIKRRSFLQVFRQRDFERNLEDLIAEQGGRSRRERRLSNRDAWKRMDRDNSGVIDAYDFEDLCLERGIKRTDAREAWKVLDDRGKKRVSRNTFLDCFPRGENFLDSVGKIIRRRNGRRGSMDFASLTNSQLERWLRYLGRRFARYIRTFKRHDVTAKDLLEMSREELVDIVRDEEDARTLKKKAREKPEALRILFLSDRKMEEYDNKQSSSDGDFGWIVVSPSEGRGMMSYDDGLTIEQAQRSSPRVRAPERRSSDRRRNRRRYSEEY